MNHTNGRPAPSDALVLFGVTGDLAYKQIFPALYAMVKRGALTVPVIGIAASPLTIAALRKRVTQSIRHSGAVINRRPLRVLLSLLLGLFCGRLITIGRGPNGLTGSRCQSALGKAQS